MNDVAKLNSIIDGQYQIKGTEDELQTPAIDQKVVLQQSIADAKMTALMSETLMQKEHIIKALEDQLNDETKRRKNISKDYKT